MKIKIVRECSTFLRESEGNPLIKYLSSDGPDLRKVKVRKRKSSSDFDNAFNTVFIEHPDLRQRCVFSNGEIVVGQIDESKDPLLDVFYIFPIDGFKFMYSPNVINSRKQYAETLNKLRDALNEDEIDSTFSEVLSYDYISDNMVEGIKKGSEIILYGIPHYYAIRQTSVKTYSTLFSL